MKLIAISEMLSKASAGMKKVEDVVSRGTKSVVADGKAAVEAIKANHKKPEPKAEQASGPAQQETAQ